MNKFWILFKKEVLALLNVQTLIPLILIFVLFYFIGNVIGGIVDDEVITFEDSGSQTTDGSTIHTVSVSRNSIFGFIDNDNSEYSNIIKDVLISTGSAVIPNSKNPEEAMKELENFIFHDGNELKISSLVVINSGFEYKIKSGQYAAVDVYTLVDSFGLMSMMGGIGGQSATGMINSIISEKLMGEANVPPNIHFLTNPVYASNYTYLNEKTANVNAASIMGYVTSQLSFVPIVIMLIILMAASTLATSMVNEKADKTLETLMTTPVSRMSVLLSKILAAGVYAALYAIVYIFALNYLNASMTGDSGAFTAEFIQILNDFGIVFNVTTFVIVGIQLFLSVLCGLAIAIIIGMMVDDIKALQSYIMPLMIVIMIPYLLSMFMDINTLPMIGKILIYAIPFTHSFTAAANLFMQNYSLLIFGVIYQLVFVVGILTLAVKIFNSDKLFTLGQILQKKPAMKKKGGEKNKFKTGY